MADEKFSIAAHLYTRLRRSGGRAIDVQFMLRDERYAKEVIAHARTVADPEARRLADHYADLLAGIVRKPESPKAPPPAPGVRDGHNGQHPEKREPTAEERAIAARYRGGLR